MGRKAPGYRLSPDHFQTVKRMLAPDWAQKMLCIIVPNWRTAFPKFFSRVRTRRLLGNLRTTTTTLSTTTGSELQCTPKARPVNFVVVVSTTTPSKVESRRPAIHKLRQVQIHCFKRFVKSFAFSYRRKSRYRSFFLFTSDVD